MPNLFFFKALTLELQCPAVLRDRANDLVRGSHRNLSVELTSESKYRLLYGGIDSDGIKERTADMTAIMAAVAQSHALEMK